MCFVSYLLEVSLIAKSVVVWPKIPRPLTARERLKNLHERVVLDRYLAVWAAVGIGGPS